MKILKYPNVFFFVFPFLYEFATPYFSANNPVLFLFIKLRIMERRPRGLFLTTKSQKDHKGLTGEGLNCDLCDLSDFYERPAGTFFNHEVAEVAKYISPTQRPDGRGEVVI
jgi:hypothetical protein